MRLATRLYFGIAKLVASRLAQAAPLSHIFARRGLAFGEIRFPLSDVDLSAVLAPLANRYEQGRALWQMARCCRKLRLVFLRLGELVVHDLSDFNYCYAIDPYRCSLDRRFALPLYGGRPPFPVVPLTLRTTRYRGAFWLRSYFPRAVVTGSRYKLWKIYLELVNVHFTLQGVVREPLPGRYAVLRLLKERGSFPLPANSTLELAKQCYVLLEELQRGTGRPVGVLKQKIRLEVPIPPEYATVRLLLAPNLGTLLEELERGKPDVALTPTTLDLYVEYVNPFLYFLIPSDLRDELVHPPSATSLLHFLQRESRWYRICEPMFISGLNRSDFEGSQRAVAFLTEVFYSVDSGMLTELPGQSDLKLIQPQCTLEGYYLEVFPELAQQLDRIRQRVGSFALK